MQPADPLARVACWPFFHCMAHTAVAGIRVNHHDLI